MAAVALVDPAGGDRVIGRGAGRLLVASALLGAGVALFVLQAQIRVIEASLARAPLDVVMASVVHVPGTDLIFFPRHHGVGWQALEVTFSCSSVPIVAPVLILGAVLAMMQRFSPWRTARIVLVAAAAVFLINLARIASIAVATDKAGDDGYEVMHRVVGSGVTILAVTLAFAFTYRRATRPDPSPPDPIPGG